MIKRTIKTTIKTTMVFLLMFLAGCAISVDTTTLDFGSNKTTETFTLTVQRNVEWSISCSEAWVTVNPESGQGKGAYSITVTVYRAGLTPGDYEATLNTSTNTGLPCPDVIVKMSVAGPPPPPPEGISLIQPVDGDIWYVSATQLVEWVSADDAKNEKVNIKIEVDEDAGSLTVLEEKTDNTGSFKVVSFGEGVLDDHTLWTTPLFKGRVILSVSYNDIEYSDQAAVDIPITLRILYNKTLAARGLDSDLDGLPDSIEEFIGTDPYSSDSDGDGIHDYNEIFGFGYFDDDAVIPDSNGDGIIDAKDREYNDEDLSNWLDTDNDGDGIPNYLEYYGYTYDWMSNAYKLWDGESLERTYYKTDPLQPSTDQDPYDDAMETSGTLMDVSVRDPGSLPMVPGYPNIVIRLEGYEATLNQEITISEGESLSMGTNWSRSTTSETSHTSESSMEHGWSVEAGYSYETPTVSAPAGKHTVSVNVGAHGTYGSKTSNTNTRASTKSSGNSITREENWQRATTTNPTDAARIKLFLKVYNHGTSAASNIVPTFTLKIGGMNIATFEQAESQINILEPGGVYPSQKGTYWVIDSIDTGAGANPISLTLDELRALECGSPVSIVMTQMLADVMLMNSEGRWESAGDWGEYMARCEAVCSNMLLDIGDGNFIHYLLYSGDSPTSPRVTFRDALMWVAGGSIVEDDNIITFFDRLGEEQSISLQDWDFNFDLDTLSKNGFTFSEDEELLPPADDYNSANLVLGPDTVIIGKPPRSNYTNENSPVIHYAYLDEVMDVVRVCASDYSGIEKATFQTSPSAKPKDMEELVFNSGIYTLEIDSSYESSGSEKVTVFSNDPSASPATKDVLKVEYSEQEAPVKPQIHTVDFQPYNRVLTAQVKSDPMYPVTSVIAYHYVIGRDGTQELRSYTRWEDDSDKGYFAYLTEGISRYNYYGLTIIATAEGPGGKASDTYVVTADDITMDASIGVVDMMLHLRCNTFGCHNCYRGGDSYYTIERARALCNVAKLDLDTDNDGPIDEFFQYDKASDSYRGTESLSNCTCDFPGEMGDVYDMELVLKEGFRGHDNNLFKMRFKGKFCFISSDEYNMLDRNKIEMQLQSCASPMGGYKEFTLQDIPDDGYYIITETSDNRFAKLHISDLQQADRRHFNDWHYTCCSCSCDDGISCRDNGSCTWATEDLSLNYITFASEICDDGIDNDLDFMVDCEDQHDCENNPACKPSEDCTDSIDNDGDGYVDCLDPDCRSELVCSHEIDCTNGVDDDNDGLQDCDDPDCSSTPECPEIICDDGVDNNNDGFVDCDDRGCCGDSSTGCPDEQGFCCNDGVDNDGVDGMDCDDPKCSSTPECPEIVCDDGVDNNNDGIVDCYDRGCCGGSSTVCPDEQGFCCTDGVDNDGVDGMDCDDPKCVNWPGCV